MGFEEMPPSGVRNKKWNQTSDRQKFGDAKTLTDKDIDAGLSGLGEDKVLDHEAVDAGVELGLSHKGRGAGPTGEGQAFPGMTPELAEALAGEDMKTVDNLREIIHGEPGAQSGEVMPGEERKAA